MTFQPFLRCACFLGILACPYFAAEAGTIASPTVTLAADRNPAVVGVPVVVTIAVKTPNGPGAGLAGLCSMPIGSDFCGVILSPLDTAGALTQSLDFSPGTYRVTAHYYPHYETPPWEDHYSSDPLILVVEAAPAVPILSPTANYALAISLAAAAIALLRKNGCA
jgi:hypothetical protein